MKWIVWNTRYPNVFYHVEADSFDEAIRKGRKLDPDVSVGRPE